MLEQQAKLNHPDFHTGAPSASTSAVVPAPSSIGLSDSSIATTGYGEQPTGSAVVIASPAHVDIPIEKSKQEQTEVPNTSLTEPAAKKARTYVNPQGVLSGESHNFVIPSTEPLCIWDQSPSQTSTAGGLSQKVSQQAHAACISQHPGPVAQKPVQA